MAIAYDAVSNGEVNPGTSVSWNHTCTGSDRILFLGIQTNTDSDPTDLTAVTYNSVAMTFIAKQSISGTSEYLYLYYLINPASGTNSISITRTTSGAMFGFATSYTGAKQSGQPDASTTNTGTGTSLATSVTTVADNCWTVLTMASSNTNWDSLTGGTIRYNGAARGIGDSNSAITPAGSTSLTVVMSASRTIWTVMASIAPSVPVTANGNLLDFM